MINPNNIVDYLNFLARQKGFVFDEPTLARWAGLTDEQLSNNLNTLYQRLNIDGLSFEKKFIEKSTTLNQTVDKSNNLVTTPRQLQQEQNDEYEIEDAEIIPDNQPYFQYTSESSKPSNDFSSAANAHNYDQYYEQPQKSSSLKKIFNIFLFLLMGAGIYVGYKFFNYSSLQTAYSLADNLAIHSSDDDISPIIGRMDLYGECFNDSLNRMDTTLNGAKILERKGNYYKLQLKGGFKDYLLQNSEHIGYVHSKFVTTNELEYKKYKTAFKNIRSDFNEMDKLQFVYRKMIVKAIDSYSFLNDLTVAPICNPSKKLSNKTPLGIAQFKQKDELNNIKNIYCIVQFSNNQYYCIESDKDAMGKPNVYPISIKMNDGISSVTKPLNTAGKFTLRNNASTLNGYFNYVSCDGKIKAKVNNIPFTLFEQEVKVAPKPPAPPRIIINSDSDTTDILDDFMPEIELDSISQKANTIVNGIKNIASNAATKAGNAIKDIINNATEH